MFAGVGAVRHFTLWLRLFVVAEDGRGISTRCANLTKNKSRPLRKLSQSRTAEALESPCLPRSGEAGCATAASPLSGALREICAGNRQHDGPRPRRLRLLRSRNGRSAPRWPRTSISALPPRPSSPRCGRDRRPGPAWNAFWCARLRPPLSALSLLFCGSRVASCLAAVSRCSSAGGLLLARCSVMPAWLSRRQDSRCLPVAASRPACVAGEMRSLPRSAKSVCFHTRPRLSWAFALGCLPDGMPHSFGQIQHCRSTLVVFASGALSLSRAGADACSAIPLNRRCRGPVTTFLRRTWRVPVADPVVWVSMALTSSRPASVRSCGTPGGSEWIFSDNLVLLLRRAAVPRSDGASRSRGGGILVAHTRGNRTVACASTVSIKRLFAALISAARAMCSCRPAWSSRHSGF